MDEYLSCFRHGENVYYLNKQGRERVNSAKICKKTMQVDHYLMRNWLYITLGCPSSWKNEIKIKVRDLHIVTDAKFEENGVINVVETDITQKMIENRKKVSNYRKFVEITRLKVRLHWVTTTHNRQRQLYEICEGLDTKVYLTQDFI
jgi:hypothetical protein